MDSSNWCELDMTRLATRNNLLSKLINIMEEYNEEYNVCGRRKKRIYGSISPKLALLAKLKDHSTPQ